MTANSQTRKMINSDQFKRVVFNSLDFALDRCTASEKIVYETAREVNDKLGGTRNYIAYVSLCMDMIDKYCPNAKKSLDMIRTGKVKFTYNKMEV